jgi:hypothetical protein
LLIAVLRIVFASAVLPEAAGPLMTVIAIGVFPLDDYMVKMPEACHVTVMLPPFGVTGRPVTDVSM